MEQLLPFTSCLSSNCLSHEESQKPIRRIFRFLWKHFKTLVFQTNIGIITFSVITTLILATVVFLITNIAIGWRSKDRRKSLLSIFLPSLIANVLSEQIMNNKTQRSLDSQQLSRINRECTSLSNRYKTLKSAMDRRVKLNTKPTVFKK